LTIWVKELYYHRPNCDFRGVKSILFRQGDIVMYMEWESDLYDFSDPEVRLKYVPQLGCSVGLSEGVENGSVVKANSYHTWIKNRPKLERSVDVLRSTF
jgi:hypothetical protein